MPLDYQEIYNLLKQQMNNAVKGSAYNWVLPSLWTSVFGDKKAQQASRGGYKQAA
jgi:hypothetical protein